MNKDKTTLMVFPPGKANDDFTLLPPSLTAIGENAFYGCTKLKNVTIPNKVTTLGNCAFMGCDNLNTVTFLCDVMIDPSTFSHDVRDNEVFNSSVSAFTDLTGQIVCNVRKELYAQYLADPWYAGYFKEINTSFVEGKEEYIAVSNQAVDLLSSSSTDVTYVLPLSVTHNAKNYKVSLIGDYALQGINPSVKEVVVFDNVEYIGAKAFITNPDDNTSTIQSVFFIESEPTKEMLSTTRFEIGPQYAPVASTTKIYVKPSAVTKYQEAWADLTGMAANIGYKIPGVSISTKYGTFSREFDTDFTQYYKEISDETYKDVRAFTGGVKAEGKGDWGNETEYHISFTPTDNEGTYVPANTGVLLKVMQQDATPSDFFYCIHEDAAYDKPSAVTDNNLVATGSTDWVCNSADGLTYIMSKGYMVHVPAGKKITVPAHRAYLKLPEESLGKQVVMSFDMGDDDSVTAIDVIQTVTANDNAACYDLSGRRVNNPSKGIYVVNGKKIVF